MFKHTLVAGALALGLGVIGASTAHAADHVEKFDDQFTDEDPFLADLCGFDQVLVDGRFQGTVRFLKSGGVHVTERGTIVLTNPDTGKTLTRWSRLSFKGQGTETVEDGILTIHFDDTFTGIPERWFDHEGKELIKDAGYANFVGELVIDLETDEVIHFHEEITTHGPHPILENGLDPAAACELLD